MAHQVSLNISNNKKTSQLASAMALSVILHALVLISFKTPPIHISLPGSDTSKSLNLEIQGIVSIAKPELKATSKVLKQVKAPGQTESSISQPKSNKSTTSDTVMTHYLEKVRLAVETAKYYPEKAKRMRQQGIVEITFVLTAQGKLSEIKSISGNYENLNDATREIISKKAKYPVFPNEMNQENLTITLPVNFEIL